jgi:ribA/ribD-fused uncharacterized protein
MAVEIIDQFQGEYRFLSNFFIEPDGTTVEHEFQAAKTIIPSEHNAVLNAATPGIAKRMGRKVTLREDWEDIKLKVMEYYVTVKFQHHDSLATRLRATGNATLIEGNTWNDRYWGVDLGSGVGENHLGQILEKVRYTLR